MSDLCPGCGHELDSQGRCTSSTSYDACLYYKDPCGDHFLVVTGDGDDGYEVEHPEGCPREDWPGDLGWQFTCYTQLYLNGGPMGDNELPLAPGRYLIDILAWKSWTDYGWEYDGELQFTLLDKD
jgi:hypothetical protein